MAFAKTIGRPNLSEIIPSISISDPTANDTNRTITVVNTGLKPWTAENLDLSIEKYFENAGHASVGAFQKDIKDFFDCAHAHHGRVPGLFLWLVR